MSSTNVGNQVLTFDYKNVGTSQSFNRLFYNILSSGIYEGGEVTITDVSNQVKISKFVSLIKDDNNKVATRVETQEDVVLTVSNSQPFIIGQFIWQNVEENYMDIKAVSYAEMSTLSNIIIFGRAVYSGTVLQKIDTTRKTIAQMSKQGCLKNIPDFLVTVNENATNQITINSGNAYIGGKYVSFPMTNFNIDTTVTNKRIDLISIDKDGNVVYTKSNDNINAKQPLFPSDMLTVAIITLPSNPTLDGSMIENVYTNNFVQSSSKTNISTEIDSDTTIEVEDDAKYVITSPNVDLTISNGLYLGCEVRIILAMNSSTDEANVIYDGIDSNIKTDTVLNNRILKYMWNGEGWFCSSAPSIGHKEYQYPLEELPSKIYGGQWSDISSHYAGLFPRISGGEAETFEKTVNGTVSGTTLTFETTSHGVTTGSLIVDPNTWEQRGVTAVNGANITIESAFTYEQNITKFLIVQNAGLPNITGNLNSIMTDSGGSFSGAFYYNGRPRIKGWKGLDTDELRHIGFDARRSSAIYGRSDSVQPINTTVRLWKRIN